MTTTMNVPVVCGVCQATSEHETLASTNTMGYCDLDTRPAPMKRWTMACWIQRCPQCGHCAPDLSQPTPGAAEVVRSEAYGRKLASSGLPASAVPFVCAAHLAEAAGRSGQAGWSMIHAAWRCDDEGEAARDGARRCREWAIDLLSRPGASDEEEEEEPDPENAGTKELVLTDLARRAGRLDQARSFVSAARACGPGDVVAKILAYEERLIAAGDTACHTIEAALQPPTA